MQALVGERVAVYWNIHKGGYSVQLKGKVVAVVDTINLNDVTFRVQPAGHAKVLTQKVKNVHAYVRGTITDTPPAEADVRVRYNPYETDTFVEADTKTAVHDAEFVSLCRVEGDPKMFISETCDV